MCCVPGVCCAYKDKRPFRREAKCALCRAVFQGNGGRMRESNTLSVQVLVLLWLVPADVASVRSLVW